MLEVMKRRGWRSQVWVSEWALDERAARAREQGWLAPGSDRELDLTNPAAVRALERDLGQFLDGPGRLVDGFFVDRSEEIVPSDPDDVYHDGRNGRQVHNAYPVLLQQAVDRAVRRARGRDGWAIARAAYTGTAQYAMTWGGDTRSREGVPVPEQPDGGPSTDLGLRSVLVSLQRSAFMGLPYWGSDIGGYSNFADREVFARWIEVGAVSPLMRFHGKGTHAPWDMPTEPKVDQEMIEIYRRYVVLHHALADYQLRLARDAHRTGAPLARPLVFNYPDDPNVGDRWDEWLMGDDLLVAPVWQSGARSRTVYLPKGQWVDFWDRSRVVQGPVELTEDVPLGKVPMFVKQGSSLLRDKTLQKAAG
jgi:alpha-glucosidase (family GH31 glycosyl hydrolase)